MILYDILPGSGKQIEWVVIPKIVLDGKRESPDIIKRFDI